MNNNKTFKIGVIMMNVLAACLFGFAISSSHFTPPLPVDTATTYNVVAEPVEVHMPKMNIEKVISNPGVARIKSKSLANKTNPMKAQPMSHWEGLLPPNVRVKALNFLDLKDRKEGNKKLDLVNENEKSKIQGAPNLTSNNR